MKMNKLTIRSYKSVWTTAIVPRVSIIICDAGPAIITYETITGVIGHVRCFVIITLFKKKSG